MDLAIGAKRVFVMMEHQTKSGESKIVAQCSYPLTCVRCVNRIFTDLAVIDVTPQGLAVIETVEGLAFDETGPHHRRAVAKGHLKNASRRAASTRKSHAGCFHL